VVSETYELFQQGRAHLRSGRADKATIALEQAKLREPTKASIREALGIAYFRSRRFPEAEAEFRAILEIAPADDYAHFALGRCLEQQGRRGEATRYFKLARCLRPGSEDYRAALDRIAS
jgi:Flp pilus assembly protein TadD